MFFQCASFADASIYGNRLTDEGRSNIFRVRDLALRSSGTFRSLGLGNDIIVLLSEYTFSLGCSMPLPFKLTALETTTNLHVQSLTAEMGSPLLLYRYREMRTHLQYCKRCGVQYSSTAR